MYKCTMYVYIHRILFCVLYDNSMDSMILFMYIRVVYTCSNAGSGVYERVYVCMYVCVYVCVYVPHVVVFSR